MCIYIFICMFCVYVCFLPMFATFTQQPLVTCMRSSDQPSGSQKSVRCYLSTISIFSHSLGCLPTLFASLLCIDVQPCAMPSCAVLAEIARFKAIIPLLNRALGTLDGCPWSQEALVPKNTGMPHRGDAQSRLLHAYVGG